MMKCEGCGKEIERGTDAGYTVMVEGDVYHESWLHGNWCKNCAWDIMDAALKDGLHDCMDFRDESPEDREADFVYREVELYKKAKTDEKE